MIVQPSHEATPGRRSPRRRSPARLAAAALLGAALIVGRPAAGAAPLLPSDWFDGATVAAALTPATPWPLAPLPVAAAAARDDRALDDGAAVAFDQPVIDVDAIGAAISPIAVLGDAAEPADRLLVAAGDPAAPADCPPILRHSYQRLQGGQTQSLCDYRGKVVLVVNTASYCGYTGQYEGLEALYRKYRDRGLVVLGFPSNDFGGQEPGTNREIAEFCRSTYGVEFPMFEKSSVTGVADNPLFADLAKRTGERPQWNFHKYLVDRRGEKVASFRSAVAPDSRELVGAIERLLAEPATGARG